MLSTQAQSPAPEASEAAPGRFLFATDVDGTLLTRDYRLMPSVKAAVTHARSHGVQIMLATARGPAALDIVLDDLGEVDFAICFGGALVLERRSGRWLPALRERITLAIADVKDVWAKAQALGIALGAYTESGVYIGGASSWFEAEFSHTGEPVFRTPFDAVPDPIFKLLAIVDPMRVVDLERLRMSLPPSVDGVYSHANYLEIMVRGVSKGDALERFCGSRGINQQLVVVTGDGDNDVSMFLAAGHSAAMPLASPSARAAAKWIVPADAPAGVAAVITHYASLLWRIPAPPLNP